MVGLFRARRRQPEAGESEDDRAVLRRLDELRDFGGKRGTQDPASPEGEDLEGGVDEVSGTVREDGIR